MPKTFYRAEPYTIADVPPAKPGSALFLLRERVEAAAVGAEQARARRRSLGGDLESLKVTIAAGRAPEADEGTILAGLVAERRHQTTAAQLASLDAEVQAAEARHRAAREELAQETVTLFNTLGELPAATIAHPLRQGDVTALAGTVRRLTGFSYEELSHAGN